MLPQPGFRTSVGRTPRISPAESRPPRPSLDGDALWPGPAPPSLSRCRAASAGLSLLLGRPVLRLELARERGKRVLLDLADAFRRKMELLGDLVERVRLAVDPEVALDDLPLAFP